jgi:hypothetical protein
METMFSEVNTQNSFSVDPDVSRWVSHCSIKLILESLLTKMNTEK